MRVNINTLSSIALYLPVYLTLSSLILLLPVFYNGYPLFYSDSAVYIMASNLLDPHRGNGELPYLSGIGYAWFIKIVSWRASLYLVVVAQAVILNILIYYTMKALLPETKIIRFHLSSILVLSLCSSMGWTVSQLMPDVFTSYLILSVFLIYAWNKKRTGMYIFLSIVIVLSILSHLTNIIISAFLMGFLFLLFLFLRSTRKERLILLRKSVLLVVLIGTSLMLLVGLNKKYYDYNGLSPTSSIFWMARLMDAGFMQEFLDEKCDKRSYEICAHKDSLSNSYDAFLWDPESEFNKTGGWQISKHEEYRWIIRDVLTTPKYLGKFLYNCGEHSLKQLVTFKIGEGLTTVYNKESAQYKNVIRYFDKKEFREGFLDSRQTQGKLTFDKVNVINYVVLSLSLLVIVWTLLKHRLNKNMILFTLIILIGVLSNAVATSSLSSVFNRFQSRITWLIPLLACVFFSAYLIPELKSFIAMNRKGNS